MESRESFAAAGGGGSQRSELVEMTDDEILRRLAEIEGRPLNPLVNKAEAFELMHKYNLGVGPTFSCSPAQPAADFDGSWEAEAYFDGRMKAASVVADTPERAICLVLIESMRL